MKFTITAALLGVGLVHAGGEDWKAPGPDDCTFLSKTSAALAGGTVTDGLGLGQSEGLAPC